MKPGVIGAAVVGLVGVVAAGAVWLRDGAQLTRAQKASGEAQAALAAGELERARAGYSDALTAADSVGGLTGQRGHALEVADEARAALHALDGLLDATASPRGALQVVGPEGEVLGKPPQPAVQAIIDRARAEAMVDAGLRLEARGAVSGAPRVLEAAVDAARAAGSPRLVEAEEGLGRARFRARLSELESSVRQARDREAEAALAALRSGLDDAIQVFPEAERLEVRGRLELAAAEVSDRQGVKRFEEGIRGLARRVPTNDLGRLLPEVEALVPPTLRGGHPDARALQLRLEEAGKLHQRVLGAARDFHGMVLARREGARVTYVDQTEVTNEAFARFVAANGYGEQRWWTPDAHALIDRFKDETTKPGPAHWRDGKPPADKARHPVTGVCVHEALAYGAWCGKRLPSLAEWRLVATGERETKYPWGDDWRAGLAHVRDGDTKPTGPRPVGSFPGGAGPTGAQDVIGNVRELVRDAAEVVAVGGSFKLRAQDATAQNQLRVYPITIRPDDIGFRCARDLEWE